MALAWCFHILELSSIHTGEHIYQQPEQRFNPSAERLQTAKITLHFRERPLTTVVTLFFAGSYENFSFRQE